MVICKCEKTQVVPKLNSHSYIICKTTCSPQIVPLKILEIDPSSFHTFKFNFFAFFSFKLQRIMSLSDNFWVEGVLHWKLGQLKMMITLCIDFFKFLLQ